MAKITEFSINNYDFIGEINSLVDRDHEEVIKRCNNILKNTLQKSERCYISVVLGSTYYKIGEYEHAVSTLKNALLINKSDEEAIYYSVLSYAKTGNQMSYKEMFYYLHFVAKNRDLVDDAISIVMKNDPDTMRLDLYSKSPISLVSDEEKIDRLMLQYNEYVSAGKINKGLDLLTKAVSRFSTNKRYLEYYVFTTGYHGKFELMANVAEMIYKMDKNNAPAIMAGLVYAESCDNREAMNLWIDRMIATEFESVSADEKMLVGLDNADEFERGLTFIKGRSNSTYGSFYLYAAAVFESKLGNTDIAIAALRRALVLYGDKSFSREAIATLRDGGTFDIAEFGTVNMYYAEKILIKFAAIIETSKIKEFSNNFDENKGMLKTVIYSNEEAIVAMAIAKLSISCINKNIDYFNSILVDDIFVTDAMKIAIITALLCKSPNIEFKYSHCGLVIMSEFTLPYEKCRQMSTAINKALAYAYAVGCFNSKDFMDNLGAAYIKLFTRIASKQLPFTDYRALAALISLGSYNYYGHDIKAIMVKMHDCDEKVFNGYLKAVNRGGHFYNEEEQDNKFSELLEKFAMEFINKEDNDDDDND